MADYSAKNIRKNSSLLAVYKAVSMVLSLVYAPVVLGYLGTGLYGIWATVLNVVSWVNYFDIGIGNGLRNKMSAALAKNEGDGKIRSLISSAYFMLSVVVLIIMIVSMVVFQFIDWDVILNVSPDLYQGSTLIIQISYALMCIGFIFSICKSLFFSVQQAHVVNLMGVVQQAAMLVSVLMLYGLGGDRLMAVAVAYGVSALVVEIAFTLAFFLRNANWIPSPGAVNREDAKEVTGLGVQFFVVQIASLVLSTTDNIVVSNIFGPVEVTPYSMALKLFTVPVSLYAAMVSPYWSSITAKYAVKDYDGIRGAIGHMKKLLVIPVVPCIVLAVFFEPITTIWLRQTLDVSPALILLSFAYAMVYSWNAIYSQAANGMSCMKMMIVVAVVQAIVNIPLSYALAYAMGSSAGVLLGTVLTMLSSSVIYPIYIRRQMRAVA